VIRVGLIGTLLIFTGLQVGSSTSVNAANPLVPNLKALPATELRIEVLGDGSRHLRFSTTSVNDGDGPLEVRGGQVTGDSQQVSQRVYDSAGGFVDYSAGFMTYHVEHAHMHFDDYAEMTLQPVDAPGASARSGAKQTFCIIDTDKYNTRLPGAPKRAVYTNCSSDVQGMSVGWGDTYRYYLFGQSIDISALPDGVYDLEIRIDPKNKIVEKDDSDNASSVRIQLDGNSVTLLGDAQRPGRGNGRH
jgi:hypothetical protein